MRTSGPGLAGVGLSAGLDLLRTYQEEVEALTKQREQLRLAEQLFDMEITSYPSLSKVRMQVVSSRMHNACLMHLAQG